MPRPIAILALFFAGCVTKEDELASLDRDGDGWYHEAAEGVGEAGPFDCDDADDTVHPEAAELCNGADDDCDGSTDEDATDGSTYYVDGDQDGFGSESDARIACEPLDGYVTASGDCDDTTEDLKPGATELCNGIDDDCDGTLDDGLSVDVWYPDGDADGYGHTANGLEACASPDGAYTLVSGDCDDAEDDVHPDAEELCNDVDDDCDGTKNDGLATDTWYPDIDEDGFGDSSAGQEACAAPDATYTLVSGDCDDGDKLVNPLGVETCNGQDDDCDGTTDDGFAVVSWYADTDADGYGDADSGTETACAQPFGYAAISGDCDDTLEEVNPGAIEVCNEDDDDCDGTADEGLATWTWYADDDGDGYGDETDDVESCAAPADYVSASGDCDDTDAAFYPGATETCGDATDYNCDGATGTVDNDGDGFYACDDCDDSEPDANPDGKELCDGLDNDCDGTVDGADAADASTWYADADGDGYGTTSSLDDCDMPVGYASASGDCDDASSADRPGAAEITANGDDDNCDGKEVCWSDSDGDAVGASTTMTSTDADCADAGEASSSGDCDDTSSSVKPGATETCNGKDDDCDGGSDEGVTSVFYADADSDGYGVAAATTTGCSAPSGYATLSTDCDDTSAGDHPGATEITGNEDDENCDGAEVCWYDADADKYGGSLTSSSSDTDCTDTAEATVSTDCDDTSSSDYPGASESVANGDDEDCDTKELCWADTDGDGYGSTSTTASTDSDCSDAGESSVSTDCNDTSSSAKPGGTETCNGADDDCDGSIDEGVTTTYYMDADSDGYGVSTTTSAACSKPSGYSTVSTDCDDASSSDYPGATETIGNLDDEDCNGGEVCYADTDGDGYGTTTSKSSSDLDCSDSGESTRSTDCDDASSSDYPGATEACDGDDDDCDGTIDDGVKTTYYADSDSDGYGLSTSTSAACSKPSGYVTLSTDCDDASSSDYPGATETIANGDDENCDGGDSCYSDTDKDGYGSATATTSSDLDCSDSGEASVSTDCDDTASTIKPGGTETCNGKDDDCDSSTDEGVTTTYYKDSDGDTYGVSTTTSAACSVPSGYSTRSTDCDDASASDYPGASESVANGDDEDCDGVDSCYDDNDGDGYGGTTVVDSADLDCTDSGESSLSTDCSDASAARSPAALEICDDAVDDDCSGTADACRLTGDLDAHSDYDAFFAGEGADDLAGVVGSAGDIDGDGIGDILIGAADATAGDGKVYLFYGPYSGTSNVSTADVIFTAAGTDDSLGKTVSGAGDFDGDGVNDILFGATTADVSSTTNTGAAYLVFGPPASGSASTADLILTGPTASDAAASSLASLGDIDGDGKDDIIVGSPGDDGAATGAGAAYVWLGESVSSSTTKSLSSAKAKIRGIAAADSAGGNVAGPGDVNGDGDPDVLVGATLWDTSGTITQVGAVYLFLSPVSGTVSASTADATIKGAASGDRFGGGLSGGDVNGDGYADICAGAIGYGSTDTGGAMLVNGPITGSAAYTSVVDATFTGEIANDFTGADVACDGDIDGDGTMDVAIGAMSNGTYTPGGGAVYVFHSSPSGTMSVTTADTIIRGGVSNANIGMSLALVPDAEGTGYAAVFVGAEHEAYSGVLAGGSWLFFGGP